jgi:hypothetical protein
MSTIISGIVTNGVVVPNSPLPEGARVNIQVQPNRLDVPPELAQELAAWQQGSAEALALVERLADEDETIESR